VPYTHRFLLKTFIFAPYNFLTIVVFFESPFQAISGRSYELPIKPNKPLQMRVFAETPSSNISEIN